jgi:hypothetical protein
VLAIRRRNAGPRSGGLGSQQGNPSTGPTQETVTEFSRRAMAGQPMCGMNEWPRSVSGVILVLVCGLQSRLAGRQKQRFSKVEEGPADQAPGGGNSKKKLCTQATVAPPVPTISPPAARVLGRHLSLATPSALVLASIVKTPQTPARVAPRAFDVALPASPPLTIMVTVSHRRPGQCRVEAAADRKRPIPCKQVTP